jgi:hypothetical protein
MPAELRYFKNASVTVNGLTAYALALDLADVSLTLLASATGALDGDLGILVSKRSSGGVETEITAGTPVAVQTWSDGEGIVLKSATWNCPETPLSPTDSIVLKVYGRVPSGTGTWTFLAAFTTEQLGASKLAAATWTVYYYANFTYSPSTNKGTLAFYIEGTQKSRIENFTWIPPPKIASRLNPAIPAMSRAYRRP